MNQLSLGETINLLKNQGVKVPFGEEISQGVPTVVQGFGGQQYEVVKRKDGKLFVYSPYDPAKYPEFEEASSRSNENSF